MNRIAIVYSSKEGQTEKIASRIATTLKRESNAWVSVYDVDVEREQLDWFPYDGVIVGGSLHVGHHSKKLEEFVSRYRSQLEAIPSAFFSVSLSAAGDACQRDDAQRAVDLFLERTGWMPDRTEIFAGALLYQNYNFMVRWIMKRIASKSGGDTDTSRNYEYTDWEKVKAFALEWAKL